MQIIQQKYYRVIVNLALLFTLLVTPARSTLAQDEPLPELHALELWQEALLYLTQVQMMLASDNASKMTPVAGSEEEYARELLLEAQAILETTIGFALVNRATPEQRQLIMVSMIRASQKLSSFSKITPLQRTQLVRLTLMRMITKGMMQQIYRGLSQLQSFWKTYAEELPRDDQFRAYREKLIRAALLLGNFNAAVSQFNFVDERVYEPLNQITDTYLRVQLIGDSPLIWAFSTTDPHGTGSLHRRETTLINRLQPTLLAATEFLRFLMPDHCCPVIFLLTL